MPAFRKTWLVAAAVVSAVASLAWGGAVDAAPAAGCGCTPPPPPPPPPPCNCRPPPGGSTTTINVNVNTSSSATSAATAGASAHASAISGVTGSGYGGGGMYMEQAPAGGLVDNLNVELPEAESETKRVSYQATRKVERRVLIQAVCLDDRATPHPASQVHPEREVADDYDGEMFRCIAGTRLQATIGDYNDALTLAHGDTLACDKMQALYHAPGGAVACRAQKPARDCNERSLLRRYGPGLKVVKLVREETYTAYREEKSERKSATTSSLTLDGGVGGFR